MIPSIPTLTSLILPPALLWATVSDLLYRKIHNRLVLTLLMLWLGALLLALPGSVSASDVLVDAAWALPGALAVLVVGFGLFRLGRVGAGDVKLMTVLCLWLGASNQATFIILTSLVGGLLALLLPLLSLFERMLALTWWSLVRHLPRTPPLPQCLGDIPLPGIPYAAAIAVGALGTLFIPIHS